MKNQNGLSGELIMIKINKLQKAFGPKRVLNGVNLEIPSGDTLCVIGKSGCGKSVLLKHIAGLLKPDGGFVELDGLRVDKLSKKELFKIREKIGYVFQGAALFDSFNVFENVVIGLYEMGVRDKETLTNEAWRTLTAVGLLPERNGDSNAEFEKEWQILKEKSPADLSGGMKKRVGVARALVGNPDYIFYDEPTTGLDPVTSEQIDSLIETLTRTMNVTSLVITHDMFSVYRVADRVVMLDGGVASFEGTPDEFRETDNPKVREFLERYEN